MIKLEIAGPPKLPPVDIAKMSYNGKRPDYDILLTGVINAPGSEFLTMETTTLNPLMVDGYWLDDCIDQNDIVIEIPESGVWQVVALGKFWSQISRGFEYEEHDAGIDWTIVSAIKFPCFGALKNFYKGWRRDND